MDLLREIHRSEGINKKGRTISRQAVRGVIIQGNELLMIHSSVNRDYKFPGGGIQEGETHAQALVREIQEECGIAEVKIGQALGKVIEYDFAVEPDYETFCMTSYYYLCQAERFFGTLKLDDYEMELGFHPIWVDIKHAIRSNQLALLDEHEDSHPWTERDTWILEQIKLRFNL
jgi:8-oxo-dGTP pyrophosphatase MutT (NUDIX family)